MTSRIMHSWVLVLPLALYAQQSAQKASPDTSSLTSSERAVLRYLENDWEKRYRTTSINLAADVLKVRISDASRLRLAQFIEANRSAFRAPARHRTTTVALMPEEKLIARAILLREADEKRSSTPAEIAATLRRPVASLLPALKFLQKFGVVVPEGDREERRYRVASQFPRRPSGRDIAFFSHRVTVNGRDKFEVAWAIDFLLLVNSAHQNDTVEVEDACAHCTERIRMKFVRGRQTAVSPATTFVFYGGGWGINNLFSSEEHVKDWLRQYPEFADRERMPVAEFLKRHKDPE